MLAYTTLYLLRLDWDYKQPVLFTPVRTCSLGKMKFLSPIGRLCAVDGWVICSWRNTEGWWVKWPSGYQHHFKSDKPSQTAQHWWVWLGQKLGSVLGKQVFGKWLHNEWVYRDRIQTSFYNAEKLISLFFCLLFLFPLPILAVVFLEMLLFLII